MKFIKRPIEMEAYQTDVEIKIDTLEGVMTASPGDWVITGIKGEKYPCKNDIFRETYEPVGMTWAYYDKMEFIMSSDLSTVIDTSHSPKHPNKKD